MGLAVVGLLVVVSVSRRAYSGTYTFAGATNGVDLITHPLGYTGTGGTLTISVGIDPTSANASSMVISVQNIINTINNLVATTGNVVPGGNNNVPPNFFDFESTALHELLHSPGPQPSEPRLGIGSDRGRHKITRSRQAVRTACSI